MTLTLGQAQTIIDAAIAHAAAIEAAPLTVAVLDDGGHLKALVRQDGASALRPQMAAAKALTAINIGKSSRKVAEDAAGRPQFFAALAALADGNVLPAPGGLRILDRAGKPVGAIGITGDTSDRDEDCALAGIKAAGFEAEL